MGSELGCDTVPSRWGAVWHQWYNSWVLQTLWLSFSHLLLAARNPPHPFSPHHGVNMTGIPHAFGFQV